MKTIYIGDSSLRASQLSLGLMRMSHLSDKEAEGVIQAALSVGINYFDHADIYGAGESESIFGRAYRNLSIKREDILIQSKAGIVPGKMYDFSKKHLIQSVEESLRRLQTDYLDTFLLHRPDTLFEPEEVAEVFNQLETSGKVRYFGVSNQTPMQIELLKTAVKQPLIINQLQMSVTHHPMIDAGFNMNRVNERSIVRDSSILEYSRIHQMTIQPWSPFQAGNNKQGVLFNHPDYQELSETLKNYAKEKEVSQEAITIAWLLRHPAKMQPIIGSMNPERIKSASQATDIELSREEWYELYRIGGFPIP
ncbi:aldo/keto reductase [Jeotgalibaca sp. PTS2502]|uniref:aldo/keto reductase n=1 Tax=Jeotgalibaca sp. PTS2502 TaxID=1903686 RepID=UPI0009735209|nr:aldo/keto reductase [Jeotgalibaca sp. PTS2502]APZ49584.1 aldo/keto reductase [Jeotgalibaca sp. PTS2502]